MQEHYSGTTATTNPETTAKHPDKPNLDELFLQRIEKLVEEHLDEKDFGNIELAREMHLSQSQLFRKLKALTGQSIAIHIRSLRLRKARELIGNSELTIAEIAYSTGFSDPSYFTRTFSDLFGYPPSSVRK